MSLVCPVCVKELSRTVDDLTKLEIDTCYLCHGAWFDYNELRNFFSAPKLFNKFRLPEHNFKVKVKNAPADRVCPRCAHDQILTQVTVDQVVVDECAACRGIWLDSGEVLRLIELYKKGKLKGKSETVKQIKKGHFDQGPIGQVSKTIAMGLKMLFFKEKK
jgi:Zn-finger nucleic acid-binding protein